MTINEIKSALHSSEYSFLSDNPHLGSNVILLTVGGSHAYGTDTPTSDLDIRGCALNTPRELLTSENFEQFVNEETDTTIYSFNKLVSLLANCNPNTIEMLGNKPEHYFYVSPIGKELLDNVNLFLSQKAAYSFGGYATAQLRRLENKANRLVGQEQLEQYIYNTLANCNPNTIEMLGNKPEHYFYVSPIGKELLDNVNLFLSQKAAYSFGGYATAQLRRLENKANRLVGQEQLEQYIYNTLSHVAENFEEKYGIPAGQLRLYIDKAVSPDMETEIFMDTNLTHYPIRDYAGMWDEMKSIIKSYNNIGYRNNKAIENGRLGKHMMHLIRLYLMCIDILEGRGVITYREKDHDLLIDIRNGKYLDENQQPTPEFYEMIDEYEKKYQYAKEHTELPPKPNYKAINDFVQSVNERVIKNEV